MIQQCLDLSKESASKYTRALDQMEPSPIVAVDHTYTETSNRNAEEQSKVKSPDLSMETCSKASNECLLNTDNGGHLLVNDSTEYVKESISSSELGSECQHKEQASTDVTTTATLRQPDLEVGIETPLSSHSISIAEDKVVGGSKCGTGQSLKELENELDLLLAL